jgi:hypothetical protein
MDELGSTHILSTAAAGKESEIHEIAGRLVFGAMVFGGPEYREFMETQPAGSKLPAGWTMRRYTHANEYCNCDKYRASRAHLSGWHQQLATKRKGCGREPESMVP